MNKKEYPIGEKVSSELRSQIVYLLQKYAGADNPNKFNFSILVCFAIKGKFAIYLENNSDNLFGNTQTESNSNFYYPLCMFFYYNEHFPNKAMFNLSESDSKNAAKIMPTEKEVMTWFYEKHKSELIGLI